MISLATAKMYRDHGFSVFPVILTLSPDGHAQKKPGVAWKKYQEVLPTDEELALWFEKPKYNAIGVATGKVSGIVVVDVDEVRNSQFESSVIANTISGGRHYYYKWTKELRNDARIADKPLDFRGDGGFVVLPPSSLGDQSYSWAAWNPDALTPLPENLETLLKTRKEGFEPGAPKATSDSDGVALGGRNNAATSQAGKILRKLQPASWEEIGWPLLKKWNNKNNPPLAEAELRTTWESIKRTQELKNAHELLQPVTFFPTTDADVALKFAEKYGHAIRFDHKRDRFLLWVDHYWEEDRKGDITKLYLDYSDELITRGKSDEDEVLIKAGALLRARSKKNNVLDFLRDVSPVALTGDEFDTQPFLLGVKNGVINLETGELEQGKQEQYVSMFSPIAYDPKAECPQFEQFLQDVFEGDDELIHYMQRALGYSITASMQEQLFFICYGEGANGKSALFSTIGRVLGDYSATVNPNMFKKNSNYTATNDIADIDRKRFITNSESIKQQAMDEEKLKSISGGDRITARRLHENNFSFYPVAKIWLFTNNTPRFDDDSYGLWRRIRAIKFPHQFLGSERRNNIEAVLFSEAPGILRWLVEGCVMWKAEGLSDIPEAIAQATRDYKVENNPLTEYLADRTVTEAGEEVSCSLLYTDYRLWMADRRKPPLTQNSFGRKMKELGHERKHVMDGDTYIGLRMQLRL